MLIQPDTDLATLSKEDLVTAYTQILAVEEEIGATKEIVREEIMSRMEHDAEVVGDYSITKAKRYSFKTPIEEAKALGAIKTVEQLDTKVLKQLVLSGVAITGMEQKEYIIIKNILGE